jgi:hypothetical protein
MSSLAPTRGRPFSPWFQAGKAGWSPRKRSVPPFRVSADLAKTRTGRSNWDVEEESLRKFSEATVLYVGYMFMKERLSYDLLSDAFAKSTVSIIRSDEPSTLDLLRQLKSAERSWEPRDPGLILIHPQYMEPLTVTGSGEAVPMPWAPPIVRPTIARSGQVIRAGTFAGLGLVFGSIFLLIASVGAGLVGMYAGLGVFALSNYISYRVGEPNYVIGPSMSALLAFSAFGLSLVALIGVLAQ